MTSEPIDLGIADLVDAVEVGAGGFGTVYRARQESLHRDVAVKMVANTVKDRKVRIRFEREIQAMGMLSGHPNIVTVYDSGFTDAGQPYILMDYMEKGSLADRLGDEGTLPPPDVLDIMVKVCGALETAHQAGVLHRDLKPENVLVSGYGEPKLGDFGIARLKGGPETGTSSLTASIEHVAPELLEAHPPGVGSDLYALGSTMYKLLTGEAAFIRPGDESIVPALTRIRDEPVPNLRERGVPHPVAAVVERSMAKDPAQRYASAADMGRALVAAQRELGLLPTPLPIREAEAKRAKEATRTIHSAELAKSIEDIRAAAGIPPGAPTTQPGPPPPGPGYAPPAGPPGPHPQSGPGPYQQPQQGYAPQPVAQPALQQGAYRQPPPKKTPWGAIAAGVGGVAVIAVVGIILATGGGGDDPVDDPTDPASDVVVVPTATTEPEPTEPTETEPTETEPPAYVYQPLLDDTETITIRAPRPWSDISGGPWVEGGTEVGWQITAAPDLEGFGSTWNVPGLIFGVSQQLATTFTPETLLDAYSTTFQSQCTYEGRTPYSDPAYDGFRDDFVGCGGTDTDYTLVAASPPSGDALLLVQFQAVEDRDDAALEEALRTFVIVPQDVPADGAAGTEAAGDG